MTEKAVSEERVINAPAARIFEILADPRQHALIDGSGTVKQARLSAPARLNAGAKFGMNMRLGLPYRIVNTVIEFEEGKRIAWRHFGRHVWRYELEPVEGRPDATLVRETFDWSASPFGPLLQVVGYPKRNDTAIKATLERLDKLVTVAPDD